MTPYEKLTGLDNIFGIWLFNDYLRVTYVTDCWLVVWDHRSRPPERHDCRADSHQETCLLADHKLRELSTS